MLTKLPFLALHAHWWTSPSIVAYILLRLSSYCEHSDGSFSVGGLRWSRRNWILRALDLGFAGYFLALPPFFNISFSFSSVLREPSTLVDEISNFVIGQLRTM